MNPLNTQHNPPSAQYYITGTPPPTSATSITKPNIASALSIVSQQQPNVVPTLNNACSDVTNNNSLLDTAKCVTTATSYMPVLLNQTLISSIDPANYQHQQQPTKITNKPVVLNTSTTTTGNVTYQILSTSQNNNLTPAISAPNGTVSVLLTSNQPMATTSHVAAPMIIRNTPTTSTANKAVQMKQEPQLPLKQQQQQQQKIKLNQQPLNTEILKQIVVGNPGSRGAPVLTPGTTLLKPTILQNKAIIQTLVKNAKVMVTTPQQQQHHQLQHKQNNNTIITTTSQNSSQKFAALGMELVKNSHVAQNVQKLPQVSLLQNAIKKPSNNIEIINETVNVLKTSNEIKVGNLNNEVSLIKKPIVSTIGNKSKESPLLKASNKKQTEIVQYSNQDLKKCLANNKSNNKIEIIAGIEINESCSLLKTNQDLKNVSEQDNITNKSCNTQVEKQKSLLKTQNCNKDPTEPYLVNADVLQLTSPRSQRSNSYSTVGKLAANDVTSNNERRHSEPSKFGSNLKVAKSNIESNQYEGDMEVVKSQELDIIFEDEEYLESSGDKTSASSEKYQENDHKGQEIKENIKPKSELKISNNENKIEMGGKVNMEAFKEDIQDVNDVEGGNLSGDDDVTILPSEEVEIAQIEIDDDDDEKDIPQRNLRSQSEDKEQLNESLLCDEQFLISSSSSLSNNSSDHPSLIKSPQIDNTLSPMLKKTLMEPKVFNQKEESQQNGYSSVFDMISNFNMLTWREKIGTARGTKLKFQLNEFNLIQLYEKNIYKRIYTAYEKPISERESSQKRNESSEPPTYYTCRRCNVQGPSVDFLAPEFCSLSCLKRDSRKRRDDAANIIRKRNRLNNTNNFGSKMYNSNSVLDTSDINNPPPLTYIRKPKFRWTTYMNRNCNVMAAPISLFLNPFPTGPNNFLVGMKLEAIDPENCSLFCVCTVITINGYRLKLTFDGYSGAYDFWVNADSMDIFPPGWCAKTNRILQPPKGIAANKFNWGAYLSKEKALPAPRHLFTHLNSSSLVPHNPFKVGMHLEAEDLNDTGKLCVASVADVLDDRIRIHFDGWDDCYDIIEDINSPYIHPCWWHEGRQQLVVPPDCENRAFNWNDYINTQGTGEAASEELFAPREPISFKPNMRLEVVDPRNPSLIRPATIISHKGHRVKLHLDGWPSDYCFWLEDDSPDLHPIGWCDATGHVLEPPPGFQMLKQKVPCPVEGCRGIGNAKNAFKCFHTSRECCPYAAENWRMVVEKPPRVNYDNIVRTLPRQCNKHNLTQQVASLQSRLSDQQILDRLQMLDNIKTRNILVQQDKLPTHHGELLGNFSIPNLKSKEIKETKFSKTFSSTSTSSSTSIIQQQEADINSMDINLEIAREYLYDYGPRLQQNYALWQKNFSFDADKIKRNPLKWSTMEVSIFVDLYLNCRKTAALFNSEDIDGPAFLLLQQEDLTEKLGMKLGPAVRLYTCILQLRTLSVTKFNVPYKRSLIKK